MDTSIPTTDEKFFSSSRSRAAKARLWLWLGLGTGIGVAAARPGSSTGALVFTAAFGLLLILAVEWLTRRALRKGEALVILTGEGIESPLFPGREKRHRWQDIAECKVEWVQDVPHLQLRLAPSAGIADKRSFWNGTNRARPRIGLAALAPEAQERLVEAVLRRLGQVGATGANPIAVEREFQTRLKALAPIAWTTCALIAANIAVWLANLALGAEITHTSSDKLLAWGGNAASEVQRGQWWRLLTATFLHGGVVHLVMNMIGLAGAGIMAERIYGHRLFALIYLGSGLVGSALSLHFAAQHAVAVGASGAVFGITGALLVAVFQHRDTLPQAFGKRTLQGIGFFIVYSLLQGFGKEGIDNAAHVGGLLGGCLLAYVLPERFDMERFRRHARPRALAATAIAGAVTLVLATSAAPAAVDLSGRLASAAYAEKGMKGFALAMQALEQDARAVQAGKLTEREADDRGRTVHAPALRAVRDDLARGASPPGDPRAPMLADARRLTELLLEALAMDSRLDEVTGKVTPTDSARAAAIEAEVTRLAQHMKQTAEDLKAKSRR